MDSPKTEMQESEARAPRLPLRARIGSAALAIGAAVVALGVSRHGDGDNKVEANNGSAPQGVPESVLPSKASTDGTADLGGIKVAIAPTPISANEAAGVGPAKTVEAGVVTLEQQMRADVRVDHAYTDKLFAKINELRESVGLPPVKRNEMLELEAYRAGVYAFGAGGYKIGANAEQIDKEAEALLKDEYDGRYVVDVTSCTFGSEPEPLATDHTNADRRAGEPVGETDVLNPDLREVGFTMVRGSYKHSNNIGQDVESIGTAVAVTFGYAVK